MRGSAPRPGRGLPQPQSSSRALPCPSLVSVDSYGSLCASRKCPQGTRSPPSPCTPFLAASPQGFKSLVGYLGFGLAHPFGATPQAPRELLGAGPLFAGNEAPKKERQPPMLHGFLIRRRVAAHTHTAALPFAVHSFLARSQDPRVGFWGGAQMGTQGQSRDNPPNS